MHDIIFFMDSQWLKTQFQLNPQLSKADLARALGLEPPAVSKILSGARQIKAQEYIQMRRFFGLPVDRDQATASPADSITLQPLEADRGLAEAGADSPGAWTIPASVLQVRTPAPSGQIRVFSVNETVMEPEYKKGEQVVVDLSDTKPAPPGVYVVSDGFGFMLRHCAYVPQSKPPEIRVTASQKNFQPQTLREKEFQIVGRVIAKLQWV